MNIFVEDFRYYKTYSLNPVSGKVSIVSDVKDVKVAGYGSEMKIGFFKKRKIYVAIFPYEESLILWVDGRQFNLRDKTVRIKRTRIPLTFTYCFSVINNKSNVLLSFWYTFITFESWPNDRDIFTYITQVVASSRSSIEKMFFLMSAELQGRNLENDPNLETEMNDFVSKQLKE